MTLAPQTTKDLREQMLLLDDGYRSLNEQIRSMNPALPPPTIPTFREQWDWAFRDWEQYYDRRFGVFPIDTTHDRLEMYRQRLLGWRSDYETVSRGFASRESLLEVPFADVGYTRPNTFHRDFKGHGLVYDEPRAHAATGTQHVRLPGSPTPRHLVIWAGPVSSAMLKNVLWSAPTTVLTINEGIPTCRDGHYTPECIGSGAFAALGDRYGGSLARLLASRRLDSNAFTRIAFAGFSAAHGLANKLFNDPESVRMVDAFGAFDSYYTGTEPAVKRGYLAFGDQAVERQKLMIMTASSGAASDGSYIASNQAVAPLLDALETVYESSSMVFSGASLQPKSRFDRGDFHYLDFGAQYTHEQHARVLAPWFLEHAISPYLAFRDGVV